jgi:hypothetical protein
VFLLAQGGGGKIVNIASMSSFEGGIRVPSHTAALGADCRRGHDRYSPAQSASRKAA